MIVPPTSVRVLVATRPVDFRKGMDGLAAFVQEELKPVDGGTEPSALMRSRSAEWRDQFHSGTPKAGRWGRSNPFWSVFLVGSLCRNFVKCFAGAVEQLIADPKGGWT